jgi:hypothetical protein
MRMTEIKTIPKQRMVLTIRRLNLMKGNSNKRRKTK